LGIVLSVTHFNHELRAEASDRDQAFVAGLAHKHDLEFFTGRGDVRGHAAHYKLTLEAAARELRYRWFRQLAAVERLDAIATGHTLDDQAETVLMKFLRGAGTRGLAGIYPELHLEGAETPVLLGDSNTAPEGVRLRSPKEDPKEEMEPEAAEDRAQLHRSELIVRGGVRVVRPLLNISRAEVEGYLNVLHQPWREDESNGDPTFLRNRVRRGLLPLLEREYNPNLRQVLSDSAEIARDEEAYWQALISRELHSRLADESVDRASASVGAADAVQGRAEAGSRLLKLAGFSPLPMAVRRRIVKAFLESCGIAADFEHVEDLLRCAESENGRTNLSGGWMAHRVADALTLCPSTEGARDAGFKGYRHKLSIPGQIDIAEIGLTLTAVLVSKQAAGESKPGTLLAMNRLRTELLVRNWQPGDRYQPAHSRNDEKLKRLFSEKRIPEAQRATWPLVLNGEEIAWVRSLPVAAKYQWSGAGDAVRIDVELHRKTNDGSDNE
jgi:tRNA(Ile)-lysidine synthase